MVDAAELPPGHTLGPGDVLYMIGPKGDLVLPQNVKPALKLQDDTTRSLIARADALAAELAAFKAWAFNEVDAYLALLSEKYGGRPRGEKGNMTLFSFDGLLRVTVQTADRLQFGPEIQIAKDIIIGELVPEWSIGANAYLVAMVQSAFQVDREGQLNRYSILNLRKLDCPDPRWAKAMDAIEESERVVSSARYIRFHRRAHARHDGEWQAVSLNLATA